VDLTADGIKELVSRPTSPQRVTSIYLNTDGARFPRPADYEARLDALLKDAQASVIDLHGTARDGVEADAAAIRRYVSSDFDRSGVKGLAVFASGGEVFETLVTAEPFRNVQKVSDHPYVVPLQAMLGRHHHIGLAVIERDNARLFRYRLGRIVEYTEMESDVRGQHSAGGWSQARFARNVENDLMHHFKDAAEAFLRVHEEDPFDALVLAGTTTEVEAFRKQLHPYLEEVVHGDVVPMSHQVSKDDVHEALDAAEQELVSSRRKQLLDKLAAGDGQGAKVARGLRHVIEACNERRVETLFVVEGAGQEGFRSSTGILTQHEADAKAYGEPVEPVDDLIDEVIEQSVLAGARIELFRDSSRLDGHPVAALLRF